MAFSIANVIRIAALVPVAFSFSTCQKGEGKGNGPVNASQAWQAAQAALIIQGEHAKIHLGKPFQRYDKYTGTVGDKYPLAMEMTLKDLGSGLGGFGKIRYGDTGASLGFYGSFLVSGRFEFKGYSRPGDSAVFSGSYSAFDVFEGTCTLFRIDSTFDSLAYFWRKNPIQETLPFRMAKNAAGSVPVEFEIFTRENDSGSERRKHRKKIEHGYDTLPSSLQLALVKVKSSNPSVDSTLNSAILQSFTAFYANGRDTNVPDSGATLQSVMDDFDREWAYFKGEYFIASYACEIEANEHGVLSIRYSTFGYAGGAHGSSSHVFESFDVETGNTIRLEDILIPDFETDLGGLANFPNCDGDPENDFPCKIHGLLAGGFAITHDGLTFNAKIAGRDEEIHIPYAGLDPIINPSGILARFRSKPK